MTMSNSQSLTRAVAASPAQITVLEEHLTRLNGATNDTDALADRLHQIADRLFGSRPEGKNQGTAEPPPQGSLGRLNSALAFNEYVRAKLRDAVERLES